MMFVAQQDVPLQLYLHQVKVLLSYHERVVTNEVGEMVQYGDNC